MNRKIHIRKSWSGSGWWVALPQFGFNPPESYRFDTHAAALAWALTWLPVAGVQATNITSESWGPWTARATRW